MLPIGVIGAGSEWDLVWRPAFAHLTRLTVKAFYDPVAVRGERVAEETEWKVASSARQLLDVPRLRGLVVLDAGWLANWVISQADLRHLPVLVSYRDSTLEELAKSAIATSGDTLIQPELRRRYTPATMRLRELTATRLGPVKSLRLELLAAGEPGVSDWAEAIDWCRFVVQSAIVEASFITERSALRLTFRKQVEGAAIDAQIVTCRADDPPLYPADFAAELICQNGVVILTGNRRVRWKSGDDQSEEELSDDRTSPVTQLDLFARRLAGGLVPVPSLDDVATAVRYVRAALGEV